MTLCRIHRNVHTTNLLRARMGQPAIGYRWVAERYPRRRPRILAYWLHVHTRTLRHWHAYQAASPIVIITRIFGSSAPAAISVARCESGLDPRAHNPSGAAGLFQLMPTWWEAQGYDPYNPATNTTIAYHLYESSGWSAWVCQPG